MISLFVIITVYTVFVSISRHICFLSKFIFLQRDFINCYTEITYECVCVCIISVLTRHPVLWIFCISTYLAVKLILFTHTHIYISFFSDQVWYNRGLTHCGYSCEAGGSFLVQGFQLALEIFLNIYFFYSLCFIPLRATWFWFFFFFFW